MVILSKFEREDEEPLCIRFANTVGSRGTSSPSERLNSDADLRKWAMANRLPVPSCPLEEAKELREAIYSILLAAAESRQCADVDIDMLNRRLTRGLSKVRLTCDFEVEADAGLLGLIAISTAELLSSELLGRIRVCRDKTCGWLFIDRSKNRSRRWCSMSDCGNLAKARRFREKT